MPCAPICLRTGVFCFAVSLSAALVQADPLGAGNAGAIFRLEGQSSFQEGCFPPCMCPIHIQQPLRGTVRIAYLGFANGVHDYQIADVNFFSAGNGGTDSIIGSGKYSVGTPGPITVIQHRLQLDLQIGDDPVQHFDSGWQPRSNNSTIDITVSMNGMYCWDRVIVVEARRVPDSEIIRYHLSAGATYQFGCFGICDCAIGPERPMQGSFALVPLQNDSLFQEFAMVDINWTVPAGNSSGAVSMKGAGIYRVGGEFAAQHRMILNLRSTDQVPRRFDSGLLSGGGAFPHIDITVPQENLYEICSGAQLRVVADPSENEICGGFAGLGCDDAQKFCKLPIGYCCCDYQGICTPIPQGCPDVWDPVCGCDGNTYSNECDADAAGVSLASRGPCSQTCGANGKEPCSPGYFCKLPVGSCDATDPNATCAPIAQACPLYYDPVCGCDGLTYGNECEADAAAVSIAHPGVCGEQCAAVRDIIDPDLAYCNGEHVTININLNIPNSATAVAVEDSIAVPWEVVSISHGGIYDATNNKIKWGPFFAPIPTQLSYEVIAADITNYGVCWSGSVSIDGTNQSICGDACMHIVFDCCPQMNADQPQASCPACPIAGCTSCSGSVCNDGKVSLCETIGYACAWINGCNDDLSGMTRAAYIWRNGECYCWDDDDASWVPTPCTNDAATCCSSDVAIAGDVDSGSATARPEITRNTRTRVWELSLPVTITPPAGTLANAVEMQMPKGWKIAAVSHDGRLDPANQKIKWGPFMDDLSRVVSVQAVKPIGRQTTKAGQATTVPSLNGLSGTVSFDGVNQTVRIKQ